MGIRTKYGLAIFFEVIALWASLSFIDDPKYIVLTGIIAAATPIIVMLREIDKRDKT